MAEIVVYRPLDIQTWLKLGSESLKQTPFQSEGDLRKAVTGVVGKAFDFGKSALAGVGGLAIDRIEYRLHPDRIEIAGIGATKSVPYSQIKKVEAHGRGYRIEAGTQSFSIMPYAHLLVSNIKVPLGWRRNRMEVAFNLLADEIAARAKAPLENVG